MSLLVYANPFILAFIFSILNLLLKLTGPLLMFIFGISLSIIQFITLIKKPEKRIKVPIATLLMSFITIVCYYVTKWLVFFIDPTGLSEILIYYIDKHAHWAVAWGWGLHVPVMIIPLIGPILSLPMQILPNMLIVLFLLMKS